MSKLVKFPLRQQPELEQPEIEILELNETDFEKMYAPPEDYVCNDKCFRCKKPLKDKYNEQAWYFCNQQGEYASQLDGSRVDIVVCDSCMMGFLGIK